MKNILILCLVCSGFTSRSQKQDATLAVVSDYARCGAGASTFTATGAPDDASYAWYTSSTGGSIIYTGASFTTPALTVTTDFWVSILSSNGSETQRKNVKATVYPIPSVPTGTGAVRSGIGEVVLTAEGEPDGTNYRWYTSAIGGSPLFVGKNFVVTINSTTAYYVDSISLVGCASPRTQVIATME